MKLDQRSYLPLTVFTVVGICEAYCAICHLIGLAFPAWGMFAQPMMDMRPASGSLWISGVVAAIFSYGIAIFLLRLWKTQHFILTIRSAATADIPEPFTRICQRLNLTQHVTVLASDLPLAFCSGFLRARLYLSLGLIRSLDEAELQAVLAHEEHHRCHYDPLRGLLAETIAEAFFFLPAVSELCNMFLLSTELAADRWAVRMSGRAALSGALHKLLTQPLDTRISASHLTSVANLTPAHTHHARIASLLDDRSHPYPCPCGTC